MAVIMKWIGLKIFLAIVLFTCEHAAEEKQDANDDDDDDEMVTENSPPEDPLDQYKFTFGKLVDIYSSGFNVHKIGSLMVSLAYSFAPREDKPVIRHCLENHNNETAMELLRCYLEKIDVIHEGNCSVIKVRKLMETRLDFIPAMILNFLERYADCLCMPTGAESLLCLNDKTLGFAKTICQLAMD